MTNQRVHILNFLRSTHTHPHAEDVYKAVVKQLPAITLATVYRNLNRLVDQGEIIRIKVGNAYRYDGKRGDHIHGLIEPTGDIIDIEQPELVRYVKDRIRHPGFKAEDVRIIVIGNKEPRGGNNGI